MPYKTRYKKSYQQPPASPIEVSFWNAAKPLIPELENEVWIDRKYRVDFLIPSRKVIIELYGFQYHNTKSKITKDAERERYLQRAGYQIIRFTGTEVYKDVQKCVNEVLELANIQPAPYVTQTSLLQMYEQADQKSERHQDRIVESRATQIGRIPSLPKPVPHFPVVSKPVARKKKFLGMVTWQIATLGIMFMTFICVMACFAMLISNRSVF